MARPSRIRLIAAEVGGGAVVPIFAYHRRQFNRQSMTILKQSTATDVIIGPFVDSTDGNTAETALTIAAADVLLSKNGQALTLKADVTACLHDANGMYNCELDATDTNTVGNIVLFVHVAGALAVRHEFQVVEEAIYDAMYAAAATGLLPSNVTELGGDTVPLGNLALMYDGTGYTDDTAPASRAQVGQISSGSAAISTVAASATVTTGTETLTYAVTSQLDGIYHEVADVTNSTEFYYEFNVGGNGIPVEFIWDGYAQSNGDSYAVKAYNWDGAAWDQIDSIVAANGTTIVNDTFQATNAHVGTGADIGKVRLQFTSIDGTHFATDRVLCSYAVVAQSVGYDGGQVWLNTVSGKAGTLVHTNGMADNQSLTLADAITVAAAIPLNRFYASNDSIITFAESHTNETWSGQGWTCALGGQDVSSSHFHHCNDISGIGTSPSGELHVLDSHVGAITLGQSHITRCSFTSTFAAGAAGAYTIEDSRSGVAGSGAPTLTFSGTGSATTINARGWQGGGNWVFDSNCTGSVEVLIGGSHTVTTGGGDVEFRGAPKALTVITSGTGTTNIVVWSGCPIAISGTGGTVNVYGSHGGITDTSTGTAVSDLGIDITKIDDILTDTVNIQDRIPAALVSGRIDANTSAIDDSATAAAQLALSAAVIESGACEGTPTTTVIQTDLAETQDDIYIGAIVIFSSGNARGERTDITGYAGATGTITVTALANAPSSSDTFVLI